MPPAKPNSRPSIIVRACRIRGAARRSAFSMTWILELRTSAATRSLQSRQHAVIEFLLVRLHAPGWRTAPRILKIERRFLLLIMPSAARFFVTGGGVPGFDAPHFTAISPLRRAGLFNPRPHIVQRRIASLNSFAASVFRFEFPELRFEPPITALLRHRRNFSRCVLGRAHLRFPGDPPLFAVSPLFRSNSRSMMTFDLCRPR